MTDDLVKTLILEIPNFIGFVVALYILVKYVIEPDHAMIERLVTLLVELEQRFQDCCDKDDPPTPL